MRTTARTQSKARTAMSLPERVGSAKFRGNMAKYLKQVKSGRPVIIEERGRSAYVLLKFEEEASTYVFGCMRGRTDYAAGTVVNAAEQWRELGHR